MMTPTRWCAFVVVAGAVLAPPAAAQEAVLTARLDTVLTTSPGTPEAKGLLPTAVAEVWVMVTAARAAATVADDLGALHAHARTVLHALTPDRVAAGAGQGYGALRAVAEARAATADAVAADARAFAIDGVPATVQAAPLAVEARLTALAAVAERMLAATTAAEAAAEVAALGRLADQALGLDRDADGRRVAAAPGAPGLVQWRAALRVVDAHRAARAAARAEATR